MNPKGPIAAVANTSNLAGLATAEPAPDLLATQDLNAVEGLLKSGMSSQLQLPQALAHRLVMAGGKRIRPYLLCLSYRSLSQNSPSATPFVSATDVHCLAAVAEWVHTATLFHDDVLDNSPTRRGQSAAHTVHGNKVAILVGDFVYAEAFRLLMERGLLIPSRALASTIKTVVEGELLQHSMFLNRSLDPEEYKKVATAKTASLFAWCTQSGAWCATTDSNVHQAAFNFGLNLGVAFQMADDLIDQFEDLNSLDSPEILRQWVQSSPPLPIVLEAQKTPSLKDLWVELGGNQSEPEQRQLIESMTQIVRTPDCVAACLNEIQLHLIAAKQSLNQMGSETALSWTLDAIWDRAVEGIKLSGVKIKIPSSFIDTQNKRASK